MDSDWGNYGAYTRIFQYVAPQLAIDMTASIYERGGPKAADSALRIDFERAMSRKIARH